MATRDIDSADATMFALNWTGAQLATSDKPKDQDDDAAKDAVFRIAASSPTPTSFFLA